MTSLKSPITIINVVELVLTIIIVGLMAGLVCTYYGDVHRAQFTDGIVFGYLIIDVIFVASAFVPNKIDSTLRVFHCVLGSILWLCVSALMLENGDARACIYGDSYNQTIAAGVLGLASCVLRGVEAFLAYRRGEE